jgi:hypothetical protein
VLCNQKGKYKKRQSFPPKTSKTNKKTYKIKEQQSFTPKTNKILKKKIMVCLMFDTFILFFEG